MLLCSLTVSWITYPCDAYRNVKWNFTDNSEIRPDYLPRFLDPYRAKCTENCDQYQYKLEMLTKKTSLKEPNQDTVQDTAYPNPFCFNWDSEYDITMKATLKYQKYKGKYQRSVDGNWSNKLSISLTVATILLLSTHTSLAEDLTTSVCLCSVLKIQ